MRNPVVYPAGFFAIDYQEQALDYIYDALEEHGNTIVIAGTGAGKTIIIACAFQSFLHGKSLVLQHTDTLVSQNSEDVIKFNSSKKITFFDAEHGHDASGDIVFAIINTAHKHLDKLLTAGFKNIVVDESHRAAGEMYMEVLTALNPEKRLGLTATPERADKKPLSEAGFTNACVEIGFEELFETGRLVRPRPFCIELDYDEIIEVFKPKQFMAAHQNTVVDSIRSQDKTVNAIIDAYKRTAPNQKMIWACKGLKDAQNWAKAFDDAGVPSRAVAGKKKEANDAIKWHKAQSPGSGAQLFSVNKLVEGYNDPSIQGVGILRGFSHRSPLKQFLGRGLRCFPGKKSCTVLDFMGIFDAFPEVFEPSKYSFAPNNRPKGQAPTKNCPKCGFACHLSVSTCPGCGEDFPKRIKAKNVEIETIFMSEISIRKKSQWRWIDIGPKTVCAMTYGAFAMMRKDEESNNWNGYTKVVANKFQREQLQYQGPISLQHEFYGEKEDVLHVLDARLDQLPNPGGATSDKRASWQLVKATHNQRQEAITLGYPLPEKLNGKKLTKYYAELFIQSIRNGKELGFIKEKKKEI